MKKNILAALLFISFLGIGNFLRAQETLQVRCTQSVTLIPAGGSLGTNAQWKWYTGSCGGTPVHIGDSYTVAPTTNSTYYVRAEGSCGTTTCRTIAVMVLSPSVTISKKASHATDGYNMTFTAEVFPTGGTLTWNQASFISPPTGADYAATATMTAAAATYVPSSKSPSAVAYRVVATYKVGSGGAGCSATASNYTYYQATCPYTGTDLVAGSCYRAGDKTALNWRAKINDPRVTTDLNASQGRKYYDIVQAADDRWWLAQNLDYRVGLTFRQAANSPSTVTGSNLALIGNFWCPASGNTSTANAKGCDNWGALYSWETTMLYNGLGVWDETLNNNYTSETSAPQDANMRINYGRKSGNASIGGSGICPDGWHVPTEYEWAVLFDKTAGSGNTFIEQNYQEWAGEDNSSGVGAKLKSTDYCPSGNCATDENTSWGYNVKMTEASDLYGFRVLPAGNRDRFGASLSQRGTYAYFWVSSNAYDISRARSYRIAYDKGDMYRYYYIRAYGMAVRCLRD